LFPISIQISKDKIELFEELMVEMQHLGFDVQAFGGETFIVHGVPVGFDDKDLQGVMDKLMDQYISNIALDISKNENLARAMALSGAIKKGQKMDKMEMKVLVDELFACKLPFTSPSGKKCFVKYELTDLEKQFS
jgi:DNA mismatch repair protein MutL